MNLWDRLLPQTILTLNLLRQSNVAPTVSAYQYVNAPFDYNRMPLATMGCAVQIHGSSERRGTWAANLSDGWYLRTSAEHYRCHVIYAKNTLCKRITDTVNFKHKYITEPTLTPENTIVKALNDLTLALKERRNKKGIEEMDTLQRFDEILNKIPVTLTTSAPKHNNRVLLIQRQNHHKSSNLQLHGWLITRQSQVKLTSHHLQGWSTQYQLQG
jgi:hypothetical protein